ncbi:MAG: aromatic ring-hydroxylating dioxygenase subunit alpha, partial [Pseudomonadota bacterium]
PNDPPMVKVAQVITPIDNRNTHYHYSISRNFAVEDETVTQHITAGVTSAFKEDLAALEGVAEMHAQERPDEFFEIDIPTDRAGLEMRRRFKRWADAEIAA